MHISSSGAEAPLHWPPTGGSCLCAHLQAGWRYVRTHPHSKHLQRWQKPSLRMYCPSCVSPYVLAGLCALLGHPSLHRLAHMRRRGTLEWWHDEQHHSWWKLWGYTSACSSLAVPIAHKSRVAFPPGWWLTYPPEKYESQMGTSSQRLGKIKNVWNHQPATFIPRFASFETTFLQRRDLCSELTPRCMDGTCNWISGFCSWKMPTKRSIEVTSVMSDKSRCRPSMRKLNLKSHGALQWKDAPTTSALQASKQSGMARANRSLPRYSFAHFRSAWVYCPTNAEAVQVGRRTLESATHMMAAMHKVADA